MISCEPYSYLCWTIEEGSSNSASATMTISLLYNGGRCHKDSLIRAIQQLTKGLTNKFLWQFSENDLEGYLIRLLGYE